MRKSWRLLGFVPLVGLGLRRLRIDPAVTSILVVVVVAASAGLVATPAYLDGASDRILRSEAGAVAAVQRNISFSRAGRIAASPDDPFGRVADESARLRGTLGPAIERSLVGVDYQVRSPTFVLDELPLNRVTEVQRFFTFRHHDRATDDMTVVEGDPPRPAGSRSISVRSCDPQAAQQDPCGVTRLPGFDPGGTEGELPSEGEPVSVSLASCDEVEIPPGGRCGQVELPVYETAVTAETLGWLQLSVGDLVLLRPVVDTGFNQGLPRSALDYGLILRISGVVELSPLGREIWLNESQLHGPALVPSGFTGFSVYASGIMAEADYPELLADTAPSRFIYSWRYYLDYESMTASDIAALEGDVEGLDLVHPLATDVLDLSFRTGIDDIADDYRAEYRLTVSLASLALVGVGGLVAGVALVLAALAAQRRKESAILVRSRGAVTERLVVARLVEALVLFVPAAVIGAVAAGAFARGAVTPAAVAWSVVLAGAFATLFMLAFTPYAVGDLGRLMTGRGSSPSARRLVVEIAVVAAGVGSVVLFRRRGLDPSGGGFDPLLAAAPLLAGVAAGVVLLRVLPYLARVASEVAGRSRGLVAMVGLRGIVGRSLPARLPAVVLLAAVALGVFGAVMRESVSSAQVRGSFEAVGANFRIEPEARGGGLSPVLDVSDVGGVEASADAAVFEAQAIQDGLPQGAGTVLAIDLAGYAEVTAGTPADPGFGPELLEPMAVEGRGTEANPIPAVVSRSWPGSPAPGDAIEIFLQQRTIALVVAGVRDRFPGLDDDTFAVLSRADLDAAHDRLDVTPTRRYVRADDSVAQALEASVVSQQTGARLISRPGAVDALRSLPSVVTVTHIYRLALWVSAALAAVAVIAGFALTSNDRTRDFGYLRAIGLDRRQAAAATAIEQLPPTVAATALGLVTGIALAIAVLPRLDLSPLTGTGLEMALVIPVAPIAAVCLGLFGAVVLATVIYSRANRAIDLTVVLRRGDRQ